MTGRGQFFDRGPQAVNLVARVLAEEGMVVDGPVDFSNARTAELTLKGHQRNCCGRR